VNTLPTQETNSSRTGISFAHAFEAELEVLSLKARQELQEVAANVSLQELNQIRSAAEFRPIESSISARSSGEFGM
jgi:hypothetical protein